MDLLEHHYQQHRDVKFYADKLSLTPKYLSKIIDEDTGMSATKKPVLIAESPVLYKIVRHICITVIVFLPLKFNIVRSHRVILIGNGSNHPMASASMLGVTTFSFACLFTTTAVMAQSADTAASVREALQAGRTVAWASKYLVGKEENVRALFDACVKLMPAHYTEERKNGDRINHYEIRNNSDLYFELTLKEGDATKQVVLYPRSIQQVTASEGTSSLTGEVTSAYVRSDRHLAVNFEMSIGS